jgi:ketosteroid isomerase-like protein
MRGEVPRCNGPEVTTSGDGVFAHFGSPATIVSGGSHFVVGRPRPWYTGASVIDPPSLAQQEARFSDAFARHDVELARPLYHADVVYVSPTVRLFGWPPRIEGVDRTTEFIALTIRGLQDIEYRAVEHAIAAGGASAFVRIHFDWTRDGSRLRSNYVVIYRYRERLIVQQELYYDPSGRLEALTDG